MFNKWLLRSALFLFATVHLFMNKVQGDRKPDVYIECDQDWFLVGGKCYRLFGTEDGRLNWNDASSRCTNYGGHLATIQSEEVQEFILAFLILEGDTFAWIGLNDLKHETHYVWSDGTKYDYSNWNRFRSTKPEDEDCVEMKIVGVEPGKWNENSCAKKLAYICQVDEGKQKRTSRDPTLCSSAKGGGWKFGDSCYNIVEENMTWADAEKYCQDQYKGHLVKILNFNVNFFLTYIMSNFSSDVWIGIKIKEQFQQQFSSGWYAGYTYWSQTPENFVDGTCVIRTKEKTWEVVSCEMKYPFICEVSTVDSPVLRKPPEGFKCPGKSGDWIDMGGEFCYFLDNIKEINWYRAHFECARKGGSLASFHSKAEVDALAALMKYKQYPFQSVIQTIFIGLYRPLDDGNYHSSIENKFVWADGSQVDYTHWGPNQPNIIDGNCVYMNVKDKSWYVVKYSQTSGYLCSIRKITEQVKSPKVKKSEAINDCISGTTFRTSFGVTVTTLIVVNLVSVVVCYFRPLRNKKREMGTITGASIQSSQPNMIDRDEGYEIVE